MNDDLNSIARAHLSNIQEETTVNANTPFMPWVDHLREVGDPIRRERDKLLGLAKRAVMLERDACALREEVARGQAALLMKVMQHWSLADIQAACERERDLDPMAASMSAQVEDGALRERVHSLDGWHLAAEALQIFDQAGVLRQHNLLSTATNEERMQTLGRVLAWWNHVGRPVCKRLAVKYSVFQPRNHTERRADMSEQSPSYHVTVAVPEAQEILASPGASFWLKEALQSALQRDPVDAANDAELLSSVLAKRCADQQGRAGR